MRVSILQIDTIMDVIGKAGSKITLLQQTDIGYRSLESKKIIERYSSFSKLLMAPISSRRVNINIIFFSLFLILLFM